MTNTQNKTIFSVDFSHAVRNIVNSFNSEISVNDMRRFVGGENKISFGNEKIEFELNGEFFKTFMNFVEERMLNESLEIFELFATMQENK